jgi:D-alanyl-D-alanine carboxypeptidase (penicillin-binding protein 5/6)
MQNHNHLVGTLDGCDGLKTGYIYAGGFCIAVTAQRDSRRVIAVVLGSVDRKVRDKKASELVAKGFAALPQSLSTTLAQTPKLLLRKNLHSRNSPLRSGNGSQGDK